MHSHAFRVNKAHFFEIYGMPIIKELTNLFNDSNDYFMFNDFLYNYITYYLRLYNLTFDELIKNQYIYKDVDYGLNILLFSSGYLKKTNDVLDIKTAREKAIFITDKNIYLLSSVILWMLDNYYI